MYKGIRGIRYYIEIIGEGEPLLLLHGFTGSSSDWKETVPFLGDYKLILVDLIGHGNTEIPYDQSRFSMEEVCCDLTVLLEGLNVEKVNIAGYSMGGRTALSFAMYNPGRVKKLILESASPGIKNSRDRDSRAESDRILAKSILEDGVRAFVDKWENTPLFFSQKSLGSVKQEAIRRQRLSHTAEGLAGSLTGMGTGVQPNWWPHLKKCKIPVLILTGEWDEKFCEIGKEMHHLLEHSEHIEIQRTGHAIHVEQPRIFGTIVDGFLKQ
ncbi:2-succinyl-6-hydroxy-2,4-cyclohexadiene-1-carboxylate synthase [Metabacillus sp. 84]|uniref:2-succinyl-6-hydroxy-2, 4-cyclohexadiene-1-carboxylate synthase n=1 Tax=Metabacillus sp. 84 TaxID=3404705 RepID=UPI003CED5864